MQILIMFRKTNTIIKKMYLAILKCTTVDIAARGHILVILESLAVSMSRSFVDWVRKQLYGRA